MSITDRTIGAPGVGDTSVNDLVGKLLQAVLGGALPEPFIGMVSSGLLKFTGLDNSIAGNTPIFNNGTNTGLLYSQLGSAMQRSGTTTATRIKNDIRREALQGLYRTFNPEASDDAAMAFADNQVSGLFSGMLWDTADSVIGFDHAGRAARHIGIMTTNQAMNALRNGQGVDALRIANGIADNLYGAPEEFSERFGRSLSKSDVATLAAHIGNDQDFTAGFSNGYSAEGAKKAADQLANAVKEYGEALRPLRDVFGSDIPGMIDALEQVTGKAIGTMGPQRVAGLASQLANGVVSGTVDLQRFTETDARMRSELSQRPGLALSRYMTHGSMAMASEAMISGGSTPYYVDDAMYKRMVDALASDSAMMAAGDDYTKAFTIWQRGDKNKTYEQFLAAMGDDRSIEAAIRLAVGEGGSRFDLKQAYGYENYFDNQMSGVGDRLARQERRAADEASVTFNNMRNSAVRGLLSEGLEEELTTDQIRKISEDMFKYMGSDSRLMNMSKDKRAERIAEMMAAERGGVAGDYMAEAGRVSSLMTYNTNSDATNRQMANISAIAAEERSREAMQAVQDNRKAVDAIDTKLINPGGGWAAVLADSGLWSREGINKLLGSLDDIKGASPVFRNLAESTLVAGAELELATAPESVRTAIDQTGDTEQQRAAKAERRAHLDAMVKDAEAQEGGDKLLGMSRAERVAALKKMGGDYSKDAEAIADWMEYQQRGPGHMRRLFNYGVSAEGMQNDVFMDLQHQHSDVLKQIAAKEAAGEDASELRDKAIKLAFAMSAASRPGTLEGVKGLLGTQKDGGYDEARLNELAELGRQDAERRDRLAGIDRQLKALKGESGAEADAERARLKAERKKLEEGPGLGESVAVLNFQHAMNDYIGEDSQLYGSQKSAAEAAWKTVSTVAGSADGDATNRIRLNEYSKAIDDEIKAVEAAMKDGVVSVEKNGKTIEAEDYHKALQQLRAALIANTKGTKEEKEPFDLSTFGSNVLKKIDELIKLLTGVGENTGAIAQDTRNNGAVGGEQPTTAVA